MTPLCGKCGVVYEEGPEGCPLCSIRKSEEQPGSELPERTPGQIRKAVTFAAFSTGLITFVTDFAYSGSVTWSAIPLLSLAYALVTMLLVSLLRRNRYLSITAAAVSTTAYLSYLGRLTDSEQNWFSGIAFPILMSVSIASILVITAIRVFRFSFTGSAISVMTAAGLVLVSIDATLSHEVSWSLVTSAGILSLMVLLAGTEKRLRKRGSSLEKYFRA